MLVAVVLSTAGQMLAPVAVSVSVRPVRARLTAAPGGTGLGIGGICGVRVARNGKYKCQRCEDQGKFGGAHVYSPFIDPYVGGRSDGVFQLFVFLKGNLSRGESLFEY